MTCRMQASSCSLLWPIHRHETMYTSTQLLNKRKGISDVHWMKSQRLSYVTFVRFATEKNYEKLAVCSPNTLRFSWERNAIIGFAIAQNNKHSRNMEKRPSVMNTKCHLSFGRAQLLTNYQRRKIMIARIVHHKKSHIKRTSIILRKPPCSAVTRNKLAS